MVLQQTTPLTPHTISFPSVHGVKVTDDSSQGESRLVTAEINCLSCIPRMLAKKTGLGHMVLPCLVLTDIDNTMIKDPGVRHSYIPKRTTETVNWFLENRDIHVIAVTSRLSSQQQLTDKHLAANGIKLVSETNPAYLDEKADDIKSKLANYQKTSFLIKNNAIFTSGDIKPTYVKQAIQTAEKTQGKPYACIVFVDDNHMQHEHVGQMMKATHFGHPHLLFNLHFNPSQHDTSGCKCELPDALIETIPPRHDLPERVKRPTKFYRKNDIDGLEKLRSPRTRPPDESRLQRMSCHIL